MSHPSAHFRYGESQEATSPPEITPESKVSSNAKAVWVGAVALVIFGAWGALTYSDMKRATEKAQTTADAAVKVAERVESKVEVLSTDVKTLLMRKNP